MVGRECGDQLFDDLHGMHNWDGQLCLAHRGKAGAVMTLRCSRRSLLLMLGLVLFRTAALATTYYVDPAGSNANDGLSPQTPWRTLLKVGISTFQPGDQILFKRDGVWNEWLTPPSSGAPGNPIKFDAYGNGQAPRFTGFYAANTSQWAHTSTNVWQMTLAAAQAISLLKFVQFGSIWGTAQTSVAALANDRDWYYDGTAQVLSVYSSQGNPVAAFGGVTPIIASGQALINIDGVSYIEVQHISLDWYDGYGVQVQGAANHVWLANISADSQVPNNATTMGFFIHPSAPASDIHLYNTDAHRNYTGYRFDGTLSGVELKNCRAYANRAAGLVDNTGGVSYSYCHFYANSIATGLSLDISGTPGPIDGGHNIAPDTPPNIRNFLRYPARITVTFDDPGLGDGPHEYIESLFPVFQRKRAPLNIAIVTGYDMSQQLIPRFQPWVDAGWDLNSHSVSHQYFQYPNAFTIQYTGTSASSVTLSIANKKLTIDAPGDPSAQVTWDLSSSGTDIAPSGLDTLGGVMFTLNGRGVFSVVADQHMKTGVRSDGLADVTAQDIKNSPYVLTMDKARLMIDELGLSRQWMNANLMGLGGHYSVPLSWNSVANVDGYNIYRSATSGTGYQKIAGPLPSPDYADTAVNPQQTWYYVMTTVKGGKESGFSSEVSATVPGSWVYVYPGTFEDSSTEAIAASVGYQGGRGANSMKPVPYATAVMATGINVQNIMSQGMVPYFQNISDAQFANRFRAMVFKSGVWGVPYGIFFHVNELSSGQVEIMLDALKSAGATLMTNTQLVDYLRSTQQVPGTTFYADSGSGVVDFRPGAASPVVDQGGALTDEFKFDLMGIDQTQFGSAWDIGARAFVPELLGQTK